MQSVYGFREAEVGLYLDAQRQRRLGEVALEPLVLQCNFRSQCDLVGWVNRVFAQALDAALRPTDRVVAFGAATPVLPAAPPPAVTIDACTSDVDEAAKVVSHVRAALATVPRSRSWCASAATWQKFFRRCEVPAFLSLQSTSIGWQIARRFSISHR